MFDLVFDGGIDSDPLVVFRNLQIPIKILQAMKAQYIIGAKPKGYYIETETELEAKQRLKSMATGAKPIVIKNKNSLFDEAVQLSNEMKHKQKQQNRKKD